MHTMRPMSPAASWCVPRRAGCRGPRQPARSAHARLAPHRPRSCRIPAHCRGTPPIPEGCRRVPTARQSRSRHAKRPAPAPSPPSAPSHSSGSPANRSPVCGACAVPALRPLPPRPPPPPTRPVVQPTDRQYVAPAPSPPSAPSTPPSAPSTPPSAPSTPPSAPSTPPSAPSTPPSAPSTPPSAPSTPPSAPSTPPSAPSTPSRRSPAHGGGPRGRYTAAFAISLDQHRPRRTAAARAVTAACRPASSGPHRSTRGLRRSRCTPCRPFSPPRTSCRCPRMGPGRPPPRGTASL